MLHITIRRLSEIGLYGALGYGLHAVGLVTTKDAEGVLQYAAFTTLPSLALQILMRPGVVGLEAAMVAAAAFAVTAVTGAFAWFWFRSRRKPERVLLTGASVGGDVGSLGYAFAEAGFGGVGLFTAAIWDLVSRILGVVSAGRLIPTGGTAIPEQYVHADGGMYRGQWVGGKKQGLGVYTYPGGGKYAGEWYDNRKSGRGVYTFPKGGWYEGEWQDGERNGFGVRVLRNGTYKAGIYRSGNLEKTLDLQQVALAARGAQQAATAASRVDVGEASWSRTLLQLAEQPVIWAGVGGLALSAFAIPLPQTLDVVTETLAAAHVPLVVIASAAAAAGGPFPKPTQVGDVAGVLTWRFLGGLLAAALATFVAGREWTTFIGACAICSLAPVPAAVAGSAKRFRLNDSLADALVNTSALASAALMTLLGFLLSAATPAPLTSAQLHSPLLPQRALANTTMTCAMAVLAASLAVTRWAAIRTKADLRARTAAGGRPVGDMPAFRPATAAAAPPIAEPPPGAPSRHPEAWPGFDAGSSAQSAPTEVSAPDGADVAAGRGFDPTAQSGAPRGSGPGVSPAEERDAGPDVGSREGESPGGGDSDAGTGVGDEIRDEAQQGGDTASGRVASPGEGAEASDRRRRRRRRGGGFTDVGGDVSPAALPCGCADVGCDVSSLAGLRSGVSIARNPLWGRRVEGLSRACLKRHLRPRVAECRVVAGVPGFPPKGRAFIRSLGSARLVLQLCR